MTTGEYGGIHGRHNFVPTDLVWCKLEDCIVEVCMGMGIFMGIIFP